MGGFDVLAHNMAVRILGSVAGGSGSRSREGRRMRDGGGNCYCFRMGWDWAELVSSRLVLCSPLREKKSSRVELSGGAYIYEVRAPV